MPALQLLYVSQGPVVIGVNQGEDADTAQAFVETHGITFPVSLDAGQQVGLQYRVIGLPASIWIDANGTIVDRVAGAMAPDVVQEKAARTFAATEGEAARARSLRYLASPTDRQPAAATLDAKRLVREEDVERRADLLLALEQLDTGLVLDPSRSTDAAEIDQRRTLACRNLIDEQLLVDAATAAGFQPDTAAVEAEIERVTERAGGPEALERVLQTHGVSIDDVRNLFQRGAVAQQYSEDRVLSAETVGPPAQAIRVWLDAERTRRRVVQFVDNACS
jgi:hypothetical protein